MATNKTSNHLILVQNVLLKLTAVIVIDLRPLRFDNYCCKGDQVYAYMQH